MSGLENVSFLFMLRVPACQYACQDACQGACQDSYIFFSLDVLGLAGNLSELL